MCSVQPTGKGGGGAFMMTASYNLQGTFSRRVFDFAGLALLALTLTTAMHCPCRYITLSVVALKT